jgi:hypothetical protein
MAIVFVIVAGFKFNNFPALPDRGPLPTSTTYRNVRVNFVFFTVFSYKSTTQLVNTRGQNLKSFMVFGKESLQCSYFLL